MDDLHIHPLTPDLTSDFVTLFGPQGACYGCWCTAFLLRPKVRQAMTGNARREVMLGRIRQGPPPGLLAYHGKTPVGWMQIGPRADVPEFNNAGRGSAPLDPADAADPRVWAISCFFIRNAARGKGLTHSLAEAGIDYVHLRQLGTPKPGRDAARKGHIAEMTAIFEDHLTEPGAQLELARAKELASGKKVALLCFEADHHGCHRKILAELICEDLGCPVEHL